MEENTCIQKRLKKCELIVKAISRIAEARNISKQTIRHYLHRYLVSQNIAALAPPPKGQRDELMDCMSVAFLQMVGVFSEVELQMT